MVTVSGHHSVRDLAPVSDPMVRRDRLIESCAFICFKVFASCQAFHRATVIPIGIKANVLISPVVSKPVGLIFPAKFVPVSVGIKNAGVAIGATNPKAGITSQCGASMRGGKAKCRCG